MPQQTGQHEASDTGPLPRGAKVGRFEIVRPLGRGSMGVVYLARDPLIDREVAVKTLGGGFSVPPEELLLLRQRFINEARSAGALRHPGIVTIYDVIEDEDGRVSIAMEYVSGRSLRAVLDDPEPIPLTFVKRTMTAAAATLDHAHSKGFVHRDIKPANILFSTDGELKIADFGIASLRGDDLASELNALGTPNYLSPERILGREADHRADIYALGVVLYELLTRRLPFTGETMGELARNIVTCDYPDPSEVRRDVPRAMSQIISDSLAREPDSRYQRAGDMARDVCEAIDAQARLSGTVRIAKVEELELFEAEGDRATQTPAPAASPPSVSKETVAASQPDAAQGSSAVEMKLLEVPAEALEDLPAAADTSKAEKGKIRGPGRDRLRRLMQRSARPLLAAAAVVLVLAMAAVLAASMGAFDLFAEDPEVVTAPTPEEQRRQEHRSLVSESQRLYAKGDLRGAEAALRRAEALSPEAQNIAQLRSEVRRRQAARAALERQAEVRAHLLDAQEAFSRQDMDATEASLALLFELEPEHEGGQTLAASVLSARAAQARPRSRPRRPAPVEVPSTPPERQEPAIVEMATESEAAEPWVDPFGTLRIDFRSERPKGVLTLYLEGEQIFNRSFRFVEKRGLIRRRGVGGGFEAREQLKAGPLELRVYLTLKGHPAQSHIVTGELVSGSLRTLQLRVDEAGRMSIDLL